MLERIIITLNEDGTFRGASSQDFAGIPIPLSESDLGTIGEKVGEASLVEIESLNAEIEEIKTSKDAIIADLTDFKTRAEAGISAVAAAIVDEKLDEQATAQAVLSIIAIGTAPEADRKRAAIQKQISDLEAQL